MDSTSPHSILVFTDGEIIGDGFIKLPFIKALRGAYPHSKIYWHTRGPSVYATSLKQIADDFLDEVWVQTPLLTLRRYMFDLIIDTQKVFLRSLRLKFLRHRQLVSGSSNHIFSHFKPLRGQPLAQHDLKRLIEMVSLAGRPLTLIKKRLSLPQEYRDRAQEILPAGKSYVGLIVGAGKLFKCWPLENFMSVAQELLRQNITPVFILGPQEESWRERIQSQIPSAIFPLQERNAFKSPLFTVALGECLQAAVANDCGGGHMMSAAEIPLVSLFGKTSADKVCPLVEKGCIIRAQDYGSEDMTIIPVNRVVDAILAALL
jgi:ADP-heptose:LPS heptosyltransferase